MQFSSGANWSLSRWGKSTGKWAEKDMDVALEMAQDAKMPMPLRVHRRAGEECARCGTRIEAIHFKDYVMCYCPEEQTGGRVLKDRRLSKLLK